MLKKHKLKNSGPKDPDYRAIIKDIIPVGDLDLEMKLVFYGKAGTGKTTLLSTFPKPILILDISEKGTDSIRDVKGVDVIRVRTWDQLDKAYWYLKQEGHKKYKTVGLDTVSGAQELAIKKVLEEKGLEPEEGKLGGWGTMAKRDWGAVSSDLKSLIFNLRELPMNVVYIAHDRVSKEEEDEDDNSAIAPSVGPRLMPSVASVLNAAVGVIGNTFIFEEVRKIKLGKTTKTKHITGYGLRIGPHAYYTTKVRKPKSIIVPAVMKDPSYDKIKELYGEED